MKEKTKKIIKIATYVVMVLVIILASFSIWFNLSYSPVVVSGLSMSPTLSDGDFGYVKGSKNAINNIKRNDVIIFNPSTNLDSLYIKRVIALPNETFYIDSKTCEIKVNGVEIPQSYISEEIKLKTSTNGVSAYLDKEVTLKDNEYFVLGDNRGNSYDSLHGIGFVKKDNIQGVLKMIVASCSKDSFNKTGSEVCNRNQRTYYSISEWKYF